MSSCFGCPSLAFQKSFDAEVIGSWFCETKQKELGKRTSLYKMPNAICQKGNVDVASETVGQGAAVGQFN